MPPYLNAALQRFRQFIQHEYGNRPLPRLTVAAVLFVLAIVFQDWLGGTALPYLWGKVQTLLALPVGLFGLAFYLLAFALLLTAFIDTSPTVAAFKAWTSRREQQKPRYLTPEEKETVQHIRVVWNLFGGNAVNWAHNLLNDLVYHMREREVYWADLLTPKVSNLEQTMKAMSASVALDSTDPPRIVRDRFNEMYRAYLDALRWIVRVGGREVNFAEDPWKRRIKAWEGYHRKFYEKLVEMHERPEHYGTLNVFLPENPFDDLYIYHRRVIEAPKENEQKPPDADSA